MPAISAAPTGWRPAFVGGSLGSGLNASLLRKLQIGFYWLGLIFVGVVLEYIQGSPSGSILSGGTHAGPGDATDLRIRINGRPAPVGVYIILSLILRLLGCLAYVRGQDVNGDGVKDDSFDPHLHVIDREGGNKAPAAGVQIMQYLAHQNGLIGGRTDYEVLVRNPIWLADYTDDLFRARFMALTPAAAVLAVHTEPVREEDDMRDIIAALYRRLLGREGSTAELDGWLLDGYVAAGKSAAQIRDLIAATSEAQDFAWLKTQSAARVDAVRKAYASLLGRTGGASEVANWVRSALTVEQIVDQIRKSPEAIKRTTGA